MKHNMIMEPFFKRLPPIELSYEANHRKVNVSTDYKIALAIPRSKKYIAWFTFYESTDICFILELTREKKPCNISYTTSDFDIDYDRPNLSLGTLFYGSIVSGHFVIEDLLIYCGTSMRKIPFGEKLGFLKHIFQTSFNNQNIKKNGFPEFSLPVMWNIHNTVPIDKIPYTIHHIQYRPLNVLVPFLKLEQNINPWGNNQLQQPPQQKQPLPLPLLPPKQKQPPPPPPLPRPQPPPQQLPQKIVNKSTIIHHTPYTMFWVMADIQNDIYNLYNDTNSYVDVAYIPNYNTSVYMNSLFRNIRENINLDYLEESDDEEEFLDTRLDKYVDLNKRIQLKFFYNKKFRKWVPYQDNVVKDNSINKYR